MDAHFLVIPPLKLVNLGGLAPTGVRIHPNMSKTLQTPAVAPEQINSGFFDATACYGIFGREIILLTAPHAAAMYFIHDKRHSVHIEACKAFLGGKILIFCPSWSHF